MHSLPPNRPCINKEVSYYCPKNPRFGLCRCVYRCNCSFSYINRVSAGGDHALQLAIPAGFLAGGVLNRRAAVLSILAYILLGLVGIPVFASPPYGGPGYFLLPTFGFLLGFILTARW